MTNSTNKSLEKTLAEKHHVPETVKLNGREGKLVGKYYDLLDGDLFLYKFDDRRRKYKVYERHELNILRLKGQE